MLYPMERNRNDSTADTVDSRLIVEFNPNKANQFRSSL